MAAEENRETMRRYLDEVWSRRDAAAVDRYVAPDATLHDGGDAEASGSARIKAAVEALATAMPDYRVEVEELLADGDLVAARWRLEGTNTGRLFAVPPSHREGTLAAMAVVRVREGRIVEAWQVLDLFGLLGELRVLPTGPPPAPLRWMIALRGKLYARKQRRGS